MASDDPIQPEEILYRMVLHGSYKGTPVDVPPVVFEPRKNDTTGLSVLRAKHISKENAALRFSGKGICIVEMKAGELMDAGVSIVPDPIGPNGPDPAHALLPQLNYTAINTPELFLLETKCA